jgi:hypothetical protein
MRKRLMAVRGFAYVWLTLGSILILMGIAGTWMKGGFSAVQELLNPFNVIGYLAIILTLAPGIYALNWAKTKEEQQQP